MDSATWCRTPAAASAARTLRPDVAKNSSTALSSNDGELATSTTTCAPAIASLRPSPVMVSTAVFGEAATTSWPPWRRIATVFEPIKPVPPMTTIFMVFLVFSVWSCGGFALDQLFKAAVGDEPQRRGHDQACIGYDGRQERRRDRDDVERDRKPAFHVGTRRSGKGCISTVHAQQSILQHGVRNAVQQQDDSVEHGRSDGSRVLTEPLGRKRNERQPKEQMQVRPHRATIDSFAGAKHMMVIIPVNTDEDEAQRVDRDRRQRLEHRAQIASVRRTQFQYHDRDDDGQHAVAECFESPGGSRK